MAYNYYLNYCNNKLNYNGKIIENDSYLICYDSEMNFDIEDIDKLVNENIEIDGLYSVIIYNKLNNEIRFYQDCYGYLHPLYYYIDKGSIYINLSLKELVKSYPYKIELNRNKIEEFCIYGFIQENETLIKNIYKLDVCQQAIFKDGALKLSYLNYVFEKDKVYNSYLDVIKSNIPDSDNFFSTLSSGFDSNLIAKALHDMNKTTTTFTVGGKIGKDETSQAKVISRHYGWKNYSDLVDTSYLNELPNIVNVLEDSCLEIGIFLQQALIKLLKKYYNGEIVLLGEAADQIISENYHTTERKLTTLARFKFKNNPWLAAWHIILRKNGSFLRYNNMKYCYPFINNDMIRFCDNYRVDNGTGKKHYKDYIRSIVDPEIADILTKYGGSTSVEALYESEEQMINLGKAIAESTWGHIYHELKLPIRVKIYEVLYLMVFEYIFIDNAKTDINSLSLDEVLKAKK